MKIKLLHNSIFKFDIYFIRIFSEITAEVMSKIFIAGARKAFERVWI